MMMKPAPRCDADYVLKHALQYANQGWCVLPVNGKKPTLKDWPSRASADSEIITNWFSGGQKNIGVLTGKRSGIVCIDIDPRNGGEFSFKRLEQECGVLPETVCAESGGGGIHYIFHYSDSLKSCKPADGIDFLADGKMFVATPSVHPDTGALYQWRHAPSDRPIADLPHTWQNLLSKDKVQIEIDDGPIIEGYRNNTLASIAGKLKSQEWKKNKAEIHLLEENSIRCKPPLLEDEIRRIIDSVYSYPEKKKSFKTQWQESVFDDRSLPSGMKATLMALSMYADVNGRSCYPTQKMIAARASLNRKTVRKYIDKADKLGYLDRQKRSREGSGFNYLYVLTPPKNG